MTNLGGIDGDRDQLREGRSRRLLPSGSEKGRARLDRLAHVVEGRLEAVEGPDELAPINKVSLVVRLSCSIGFAFLVVDLVSWSRKYTREIKTKNWRRLRGWAKGREYSGRLHPAGLYDAYNFF